MECLPFRDLSQIGTSFTRRARRTSPACRSWSISQQCAPRVATLKKDPKIIEPLVPVDLVVDHSVQVDFFGSPDALRLNLEIEFQRNRERYQFLKWASRPLRPSA